MPWLQALDKAYQAKLGELGLLISNAVLAGVAPGSLKNGDRVLKRMQKQFRSMAGL